MSGMRRVLVGGMLAASLPARLAGTVARSLLRDLNDTGERNAASALESFSDISVIEDRIAVLAGAR